MVVGIIERSLDMEFFKEVVTGEIVLGEYIISDLDNEHIWISLDRGEGGQFKKAEFEEVVATFYRENF